MEIVREIHEGRATVSLTGRLDATWSDGVAEALGECIRAGAHVVRLDLAGVVFLSSAGIRVLLASYRDLARIGGSLAVVQASDAVFTVLQMSGLTDLLQVKPSAPATSDGPSRSYERSGTRFEAWRLAESSIRVQAIGDPATFLSGGQAKPASRRLSFPRTGFGIGVERTLAWNRNAPATLLPSMAVDLMRGNRIELPWLSGKVVELGRQLGVPTPVHSFLFTALKPYIMGAPA